MQTRRDTSTLACGSKSPTVGPRHPSAKVSLLRATHLDSLPSSPSSFLVPPPSPCRRSAKTRASPASSTSTKPSQPLSEDSKPSSTCSFRQRLAKAKSRKNARIDCWVRSVADGSPPTRSVIYYLAGLTCNEDTAAWKGGFIRDAAAEGTSNLSEAILKHGADSSAGCRNRSRLPRHLASRRRHRGRRRRLGLWDRSRLLPQRYVRKVLQALQHV